MLEPSRRFPLEGRARSCPCQGKVRAHGPRASSEHGRQVGVRQPAGAFKLPDSIHDVLVVGDVLCVHVVPGMAAAGIAGGAS